ncbi:MaoC/PaaZ C-terminal domain-containing protein [Aeromicrobium alkaliterrae]|uniref:MaoC-like domain-containing protein n=1 Tax=Aeromicrobium alkaliterrae TaxID=302168 RepID=A0ABP4WCC5_9ACTN
MTDGARFAEDITVGEPLVLGRRRLSEREIIDFATLWDPQPFHVDPAQRSHPRFEGVIASGVQTMAVLQRMCVVGVFSSWRVVAGRALGDVVFHQPVLPELELHGEARVESVELDRPRMGLVRLHSALRDGDGRPVLTMVTDTYVERRHFTSP